MYWSLHPDPTQRIQTTTLLYALEDMVQVEYGRMSPRKATPYSPPSSASNLVKFRGCAQSDDDRDLFINAARPIHPAVVLPSQFRRPQTSRGSQSRASQSRASQSRASQSRGSQSQGHLTYLWDQIVSLVS